MEDDAKIIKEIQTKLGEINLKDVSTHRRLFEHFKKLKTIQKQKTVVFFFELMLDGTLSLSMPLIEPLDSYSSAAIDNSSIIQVYSEVLAIFANHLLEGEQQEEEKEDQFDESLRIKLKSTIIRYFKSCVIEQIRMHQYEVVELTMSLGFGLCFFGMGTACAKEIMEFLSPIYNLGNPRCLKTFLVFLQKVIEQNSFSFSDFQNCSSFVSELSKTTEEELIGRVASVFTLLLGNSPPKGSFHFSEPNLKEADPEKFILASLKKLWLKKNQGELLLALKSFYLVVGEFPLASFKSFVSSCTEMLKELIEGSGIMVKSVKKMIEIIMSFLETASFASDCNFNTPEFLEVDDFFRVCMEKYAIDPIEFKTFYRDFEESEQVFNDKNHNFYSIIESMRPCYNWYARFLANSSKLKGHFSAKFKELKEAFAHHTANVPDMLVFSFSVASVVDQVNDFQWENVVSFLLELYQANPDNHHLTFIVADTISLVVTFLEEKQLVQKIEKHSKLSAFSMKEAANEENGYMARVSWIYSLVNMVSIQLDKSLEKLIFETLFKCIEAPCRPIQNGLASCLYMVNQNKLLKEEYAAILDQKFPFILKWLEIPEDPLREYPSIITKVGVCLRLVGRPNFEKHFGEFLALFRQLLANEAVSEDFGCTKFLFDSLRLIPKDSLNSSLLNQELRGICLALYPRLLKLIEATKNGDQAIFSSVNMLRKLTDNKIKLNHLFSVSNESIDRKIVYRAACQMSRHLFEEDSKLIHNLLLNLLPTLSYEVEFTMITLKKLPKLLFFYGRFAKESPRMMEELPKKAKMLLFAFWKAIGNASARNKNNLLRRFFMGQEKLMSLCNFEFMLKEDILMVLEKTIEVFPSQESFLKSENNGEAENESLEELGDEEDELEKWAGMNFPIVTLIDNYIAQMIESHPVRIAQEAKGPLNTILDRMIHLYSKKSPNSAFPGISCLCSFYEFIPVSLFAAEEKVPKSHLSFIEETSCNENHPLILQLKIYFLGVFSQAISETDFTCLLPRIVGVFGQIQASLEKMHKTKAEERRDKKPLGMSAEAEEEEENEESSVEEEEEMIYGIEVPGKGFIEDNVTSSAMKILVSKFHLIPPSYLGLLLKRVFKGIPLKHDELENDQVQKNLAKLSEMDQLIKTIKGEAAVLSEAQNAVKGILEIAEDEEMKKGIEKLMKKLNET